MDTLTIACAFCIGCLIDCDIIVSATTGACVPRWLVSATVAELRSRYREAIGSGLVE